MKKYLPLVMVSVLALANIGPFPGSSSGGGGGGGSGTVTSVGMSVPSLLSVTGSPVTTSGTLAVSYSGTALPVANGGTGLTTLTSANVILGAGTSTPTFVAPSTSGNLLTSNGSTWTSAAPAAPVISYPLLGDVGSASAPTYSFTGGAGFGNKGMYSSGTGVLDFAAGGVQALSLTSTALRLPSSDDRTKYWSFLSDTATGLTVQNLSGNANTIIYKAAATNVNFRNSWQDSSGAQLFAWELYGTTVGSGQNGLIILKNNLAANRMISATRGVAIGGDVISNMNTLTVTANVDATNVRGTTTANAATTITGSSTTFTYDFGIGDYISLSSASTTYAKITAIASDTSLTVDTALGNGTSQTMNRKSSPLRVVGTSGVGLMQFDGLNKLALNAAANGTIGQATCDSTNEVTVNNTKITASSKIFYSPNGAVVTTPWTSTRTAGTSFGFKCGAADSATVDYFIVEPAI